MITIPKQHRKLLPNSKTAHNVTVLLPKTIFIYNKAMKNNKRNELKVSFDMGGTLTSLLIIFFTTIIF